MTTDRFKSRPEPGTRVELSTPGPVEPRSRGIVHVVQPDEGQRVTVIWDDGHLTTVRCEQLRPEASLPREDADLDAIEERARRHQRDFSPYARVPDGLTINELVQRAIGAVAQMTADVEALLARVRTADTALAYERTQTQAMKDYGDAAVVKLNEVRFAARDAEKARTVETAEECAALAEGAVIRDAFGDVHVRKGSGIEVTGAEGVWTLAWVKYPAAVLAQPVPPTPEEDDRA